MYNMQIPQTKKTFHIFKVHAMINKERLETLDLNKTN